MFPTFDMLAAYGIVPSNKTTYSLSQITNALQAQTGHVPYIGCAVNGTSLSEVWYFGHVFGTVSVVSLGMVGMLMETQEQFGHFKTIDSVTASSCSNATGGIHYYERSLGSEHEVR